MQIVRRARAGMVCHHAPALGRLVVHVGGDGVNVTWAFFAQHFDAFKHAVNTGAQSVQLAHLDEPGTNAAIGKHGLKRAAYGDWAQLPGATGVNADCFVLIAPAGHELFNIAVLQGVVKRGFDVVNAERAGLGSFEFSHRMSGFNRSRAASILRLIQADLRGIRLW